MIQIKLYDYRHFEHIKCDGFYETGRTIYNADNHEKPVKKDGSAPQSLLKFCRNWHCNNDAINLLTMLGFTKKNSVVWEKQ